MLGQDADPDTSTPLLALADAEPPFPQLQPHEFEADAEEDALQPKLVQNEGTVKPEGGVQPFVGAHQVHFDAELYDQAEGASQVVEQLHEAEGAHPTADPKKSHSEG